MTAKRFGMYQNTLYDDGNILNLFNAMKLLNHFDKENTKLIEENEQLKQQVAFLEEFLKTGGQYEYYQKVYDENERFHNIANDYNISFDKLCETFEQCLDENEQLKQQLQKIENDFEVEWTQNYREIDRDKLHIKDKNTEIWLDGANLFIEVYIPQINEYYRFKYKITGRSLMIEFIENYNSKEDME